MSYAQPPPQYAQPQYGQPIAQPMQMGAVALPPGTALVYLNGVPGYYTSEPFCGPITCLLSMMFFPVPLCCCPCDTKQEFVPLPAQQYAGMAPQMQQMQPQIQQMPPQYGQPQPQYYPPTK